MDKKTICWLIVPIMILVGTALLVSCATPKTPIPALENTTWVLQSYGQPGNLKTVIGDAITTVFDNAKGQVTGFTGLNRYGGGYELKDDKLSIQRLMLTALSGSQPLIEQEAEFLKLLQAAESYQIEGDKLTITCGSQVLIFTKKPTTTTQSKSPPQFTKIDAPLTLDGTKPGTDIPKVSVVYHWANGITEVYGPNNKLIFVAKDSEAADIPHPTPPGSKAEPSPATYTYQVPSGTSIRNDVKEGNDIVTKMYLGNWLLGDRLILTIIKKAEDYKY